MNVFPCSGGGESGNAAVAATGSLIINRNPLYKYIRISNLSSEYVFITPKNVPADADCPAALNTGIVLAPKGTAGWTIEFNNTNMFHCDFWAIAGAEAVLSIQLGF